jgi:hypothetical protein
VIVPVEPKLTGRLAPSPVKPLFSRVPLALKVPPGTLIRMFPPPPAAPPEATLLAWIVETPRLPLFVLRLITKVWPPMLKGPPLAKLPLVAIAPP